MEYYAQAHLVMQDLNRELNRWLFSLLKYPDSIFVFASDTLVGSDLVRPTLMTTQSNGLESTEDQLATVSLASPPPSFPKNAHVF